MKLMKKIILNTFFPKKCLNCKKIGTYICPDCFTGISYNQKNVCFVCGLLSNGVTHSKCLRDDTPDGSFVICLNKGVVKRLINSFINPPYIKELGVVIGRIMAEELSQNEAFYNFLRLNPVIVPMPIIKAEFRARGYNQAKIISDYVAQYFNIDVIENLLIKEKFGIVMQDKLNMKKNKRNTNKTIGKSVILIEDLLSDRSTLTQVSKVLKKHGIKSIMCVAFACK